MAEDLDLTPAEVVVKRKAVEAFLTSMRYIKAWVLRADLPKARSWRRC